MTRPYTICHLFCSLDGKISGPFMSSPASRMGLAAYGHLAGELDCQATVYGTTTMLDFCPGYYDDPYAEPGDIDPRTAEDFIADATAKSYIVSLDRRGRLEYPGSTMTRRGKTSHLIAVLTRQARPEYLAYLQRLGVSYVFAGEDDIDCAVLLEKLSAEFGIKRVLVAGGGRIDWSFLEAACLDEVSLVVAPIVDGSPHAATVFERMGSTSAAVPLSLASTQDIGEGTLWLRYRAQ